ncbi:hypothetical protein AAG906_021192 [Vitis piasezkii]
MSQRIQLVTAAKKNICLRMRMMIPFNVPETSVGQLWMADDYEKVISIASPTLALTSQAREPKCFAMTIEGSTILLISEVARLNSLKKYFERSTIARASNYDDLLYYQELCRVHNAAEFSTDIGSELEEATRNHSLLDGYHLQPSFRRWYHSIEYHCRGHQTFRRGCGISSHGEPFCGTKAQCLAQGDDLVSHGRNTMVGVAPRERLE